MPKLTLTDKEKVTLELYINFLVHNNNPCDGCSMAWQCDGCLHKNAYQKKLAKYDVADLLKYKEIKEYVDSSVKLTKCHLQVESLKADIYNLEKKISEIMDSVDLVKDSEKKSNDTIEFYRDNCCEE